MPLSARAGSVVPPFGTRLRSRGSRLLLPESGLLRTYNFRDVGGYAGLDGRTVRWRRLFRADSLHRLGEADAEAFAELGVRTVIDLRRPFEVERYGRVAEHARPGLPQPRAQARRLGRGRAPRRRAARALAGRPLPQLRRGRPGRPARRAAADRRPGAGAGGRALHGRQGPHRHGLRADPEPARGVRRGHRRRLRADHRRRCGR